MDDQQQDTVSALIAQLQSGGRTERDSVEQLDAIFKLGGLGHQAMSAVPRLERLLDEDPPICWTASDALFRITGESEVQPLLSKGWIKELGHSITTCPLR